MFAAVQALIAPLLASVQARLTLTAGIVIRRAVLLFAAALFGVGAVMFLSVGIVFALSPSLGPAGALLVMALIWAAVAGLCVMLSRPRPSTAMAAVAVAPAAAPPRPAAPWPTAPYPAAPPPGWGTPPPAAAMPPGAAPPVGTAAPGSRLSRLRRQVGRAAPLLAIGALVAGIVAGRR